jgi:phosphate starvation-inducible membrane PsiE
LKLVFIMFILFIVDMTWHLYVMKNIYRESRKASWVSHTPSLIIFFVLFGPISLRIERWVIS